MKIKNKIAYIIYILMFLAALIPWPSVKDKGPSNLDEKPLVKVTRAR